MGEIKINHMAKIYGHASLEVKTAGKRVERCELHIVESSRFFDEDRRYTSSLFFEWRETTPEII